MKSAVIIFLVISMSGIIHSKNLELDNDIIYSDMIDPNDDIGNADVSGNHRCAFLEDFEFCYYTTKMTYGGALAFCRAHNGDLTSINSQAEQDTVQGLVNTTTTNEVWIGYNDDMCTGINWRFTDGRGGYTNWQGGQPNMAIGNCGIIWSRNGKWYAKPCLLTYEYVCRMYHSH